MSGFRRTLLIAITVFLAALGGVYAGRTLTAPPPPPENEIHALLHDGLNLDAKQLAKLETLEKQFAIRKQALEFEMRADNAKLAEAIEKEHGYGPDVPLPSISRMWRWGSCRKRRSNIYSQCVRC